MARAQAVNDPFRGPEILELPTELQPTIAASVPALADFKTALYRLGYKLQFGYVADGLAIPAGGVKQEAAYEGLLYMALDADLAKIAGLDGLSFFCVNAYQIHGRQLSGSSIFNPATVDNIEARPTTRLFELWVEQNLGELASIRIGQLTADTEFFIGEFASLYINGTFGWPVIFTLDLPGGGGPHYPLSTPGVRLKVNPDDHLALLTGMFNGDPAGTGFVGTEQIKDPAGLNFRLKGPPLLCASAPSSGPRQLIHNTASNRISGIKSLT
ncbi:MAG: carbohydrate porin [Methylocella sp.]